MSRNRIEKAYSILKSYNATNNQILYYKALYNKGGFVLEDFAVQYILNNYDFDRITVNKNVEITPEQGAIIQEKFNLEFTPRLLFISDIIGEMGGSYHAYAQFRKSVPIQLMYIRKNGIITDFNSVDYTETKVDFESFNKMTEDSGRKLFPHQEDAVKFLVTNKKSILADSMGLGKAQPVDTLIPTPDGFRRMGNLEIGDFVFSSDGKKHKVLGVYPQGEQRTLKIRFKDDTETVVSENHLCIIRNVYEKGSEWEVVEAIDIFENGWLYQTGKTSNYTQPCYEIPITKPVEFNEKEHYIHPYIIGLYIGDPCGDAVMDSISLPVKNKEVGRTKDYVNSILKDGYTLETKKWLDVKKRYRVIDVSDESTEEYENNLFYKEIDRLGLNTIRDFRVIPEEYIIDSADNRLSLLRGIMDANGRFGRMGLTFQFRTHNETLATQFIELVRSLGGYGEVRKRYYKPPRYFNNWRLEFKCIFNLKINPFLMSSKAKTFDEKPEYYSGYKRLIKNISTSGVRECVCIKVDSDDSSYLTNDYIVTHNTTSSIVASLAGNFKNILVITKANLKTQWKREISLYEDADNIEIVKGSKWTPGKKFTVINYDIISNFYEVPMEIEYQKTKNENGKMVYILDGEGNKIPEWVKDKKTGELVPKMVKSRKKSLIKESLENSPLYLDDYDCVIIDECHLLSNNKSIRYRTISDFLSKSNPKAIYLITGTPITKDTSKLYNVLKLINHPITYDYEYYMKQFCGARKFKRNGKEFLIPQESTNLEELRKKIQNSYIRRVFSDLPNMPEKTIYEKEFDLDAKQQAQYEKLWDEYMSAQNNIDPNNKSDEYRQLIEGGIVRKYLAMEMIPNTIELIDSVIDGGEKIVVMTNYIDELNAFKKYYKDKCVVYDGSNTVTAKKKDKAVRAFIEDPNVMVFVGNIASASVGLNLDVASKLVFNSYSWTYSDNSQAEDRIYRVSQKNHCQVTYMLWTDSISFDMYNTVMKKKMVAEAVIKKESEK